MGLGYQGSDLAIITLSDNSSRSPEEEHTRSQPQVTRLVECQEPLLSSSSPSVPLLQLIKDEETHIEQEKVVSFILLSRKDIKEVIRQLLPCLTTPHNLQRRSTLAVNLKSR